MFTKIKFHTKSFKEFALFSRIQGEWKLLQATQSLKIEK